MSRLSRRSSSKRDKAKELLSTGFQLNLVHQVASLSRSAARVCAGGSSRCVLGERALRHAPGKQRALFSPFSLVPASGVPPVGARTLLSCLMSGGTTRASQNVAGAVRAFFLLDPVCQPRNSRLGAQGDDEEDAEELRLQEQLMRETESGFVVGEEDDAARFMNFEMGHNSEEESADGGADGAKSKGAKKRGALNAQPKRKKDEPVEAVPASHRISHMFLNSKGKGSKRSKERLEDDAEEEGGIR